MKTKEQIAVKQFKKSEMKGMERKDFEENFIAYIHNCIELSEGVVYADKYVIWENDVALYYGGHYIGVLSLKGIRGIRG
jgi:hypothetical protein